MFDRQRNEIKTYKQSPENLKATLNETITYEWKFKLSKDFSPSKRFTHLHQIKAVGEKPKSKPIFTLSTKKGKEKDLFQLRHSTGDNQEVLKEVDLKLFKENWVHVIETIHFNKKRKGTYSVKITNLENKETVIFKYNNNKIQNWNNNAEFNRPKWGIYRSLKDLSLIHI